MKTLRKFLLVGILTAIVAAPMDAAAVVREYFIAADEVLWDYAPSYPTNLMTGEPFTAEQQIFVADYIGRTYLKSLYREYTDASFSVLKPTDSREEHLGTLGPIIYAEVGDRIIVHFKNNTTHPASVHPHGVFYTKANEGAPYSDGTSAGDKGDDAVPPGGEYTYRWEVPGRAGPAKNDPSSIVWLYHSHADETADTNAGLIGAMVITRKGMAKNNGKPRDVDREFFSLFTVFNENASVHFTTNSAGVVVPIGAEADFEESNLMHGINGLLWGNNTGYTFNVGDRVRWYVMSMGTEVDLHTPHWHGITLKYNGNRLDVAEVLPAAAKTLDLKADNPGTWMFHCHVNDHLEAGMMTTFTITDPGAI